MKITIDHSKGLSSHNALLIKAVLMSKGPVCEVGAGLFSTPMLHWLCKAMKKKLRTYENDDVFFKFAKRFQSSLHRIRKVDNWDDMEFSKHWGVVLIDHAPGSRRFQDIINFKDTADYIVIHDTEPRADKIYHYSKAWPHFKYRYNWTDGWPNSTVVSNFYSLEDYEKPIGICKPKK